MMAPAPRAWSAFVCGDPGDGTLLIVDWLVLAAAATGRSARAVAIEGTSAHPHGMLVQVGDVHDDSGLLDLPSEGVDLLVAGEHMELARAIAAGWCDPARTVVVASTRRRFQAAERVVDAPFVLREREIGELAQRASLRYVAFDGPEVSGWYSLPAQAAPGLLLGAIDGSGATPFDAQELLDAVARLGVASSLHARAFPRGVRLGRRVGGRVERTVTASQFARRRRQLLPRGDRAAFTAMVAGVDEEFPEVARGALHAGVFATCDFLDPAWAGEYLERCRSVARELRVAVERDGASAAACDDILARYAVGLANLMCYVDVAHAAHVRLRPGRMADLRRRHGLRRDEAWTVVDHLAIERAEVAELTRRRLPTPGAAPVSADPLLAGVSHEAIDSTSVAGVARLRRLAALRAGRRASARHALELDAVDSFTAAVCESIACDLDLARIAVASAALVEGSGAARAATRTAARVFWGRVIRHAFAVDRAAGDEAMRFSRLVVPFVWNEIASSGTLALWEHAGKVVGISLHAARGGTHEQAMDFARALAAPQARRSPATRALLEGTSTVVLPGIEAAAESVDPVGPDPESTEVVVASLDDAATADAPMLLGAAD